MSAQESGDEQDVSDNIGFDNKGKCVNKRAETIRDPKTISNDWQSNRVDLDKEPNKQKDSKKKKRRCVLSERDEIFDELRESRILEGFVNPSPMAQKYWSGPELEDMPKIDSDEKINEWLCRQRELMTQALEQRLVCPVCETECKMKCTRCKSVWYCSRECQGTDWPKHKKICNLMKHVAAKLTRMDENCAEIFSRSAGEMLYCLLTMQGIQAEIVYCVGRVSYLPMYSSIFPGLGVVIADGQIFDPTILLPNNRFFRPGVKREYKPLPKWGFSDSLELDHIKRAYINTRVHLPTLLVYDKSGIDPLDLRRMRLFEIWCIMEDHYLDVSDKESLIELFKEENIKNLQKATGVDFRIRVDKVIKEFGSEELGRFVLVKDWIDIWKQMDLKPETRVRIKFNPCPFYDWAGEDDSD